MTSHSRHSRHSRTGRAGAPALLATLGLLALAPAGHAAYTVSTFATGAGVGKAPDSVTVAGNSVYVEYGNGADSAAPIGTGGFSTIARYDFGGNLLSSLNIQGSVDGLRLDPYTNQLWALQNQDGNPGLTTLDLSLNPLQTYTYATTSMTRGYDDAQFLGGNAYLSYTNPAAPADAVVVSATLGAGNVITTAPVLTQGVSGVMDVDALNLTADGKGLLLTGGDDGTLASVSSPGTASQSVKTVSLTAGGAALSGLDDATFVPAGAQTLLVAGTSSNTIYAITGAFTPGQLLASIGSTNSLDLVDPNSGAATVAVAGLTGAHGQAYLPAGVGFTPAVPEPSSLALLGLPLAGLLLAARRRRAA